MTTSLFIHAPFLPRPTGQLGRVPRGPMWPTSLGGSNPVFINIHWRAVSFEFIIILPGISTGTLGAFYQFNELFLWQRISLLSSHPSQFHHLARVIWNSNWSRHRNQIVYVSTNKTAAFVAIGQQLCWLRSVTIPKSVACREGWGGRHAGMTWADGYNLICGSSPLG